MNQRSSDDTAQNQDLITLGWREWLALPALNIAQLCVKVDTGARSSALHAFAIESIEREGKPWIRFGLHPVKDRSDIEIWREAPLVDERQVTDSGGHSELRPTIASTISIGSLSFDAEITLTNRDNMRFRMLLGRTAMNGRCLVNPQASWLTGKPSSDELEALHRQWQDERPA